MKRIINPWAEMQGYKCFGCAPHNPWGLKMEFYEEGEEIISRWTPDARYQGWHDTLHGGIQSVLLDEIGGWVIIRKLQTAGVTSKMDTRFLHAVSTTGGEVTLRAHVKEIRRNLVTVEATLSDAEGKVCTISQMIYYTFTRERAEQEMLFRRCCTEDELPDNPK